MQTESLELSALLPATPEDVYAAWLDSAGHSLMSGGSAQVSAEVGAPFSAWGGYIRGVNLALDPGRRIVQAWRTSDFPAEAADSEIEIVLSAEAEGTRLLLTHRRIPFGQGPQYLAGWQERYFSPMQRHFSQR